MFVFMLSVVLGRDSGRGESGFTTPVHLVCVGLAGVVLGEEATQIDP
jgi:hypothetical protein